MKSHSLAKRWRTRINWEDRTQLANPLNRRKVVRDLSKSAYKDNVRGEELSAIKSRMRQTSRDLFTEAFSEVWTKPFTAQEQEQFKHHLARSVEKLTAANPRFKTAATTMVKLISEPKTVTSQSVLSEAVALSKSKGKWANATTNYMAEVHLRPALISAMVETAVGMYFLRIFHAQGINATPSQVMHALREKFGSLGNEKYIEVKKSFEQPPSPEDVRDIYSRVRNQRKSAKKEVWSRRLAEADQRMETFENNRPAIRTALKDVFLPPNARRKLIEKAVKRLLNEDGRALSDLHTQAVQLSAQFLRRKMEELGYSLQQAKELLERVGINGIRIDENALHELHLELATTRKESRREVIKVALERLSKIPHPERDLQKTVEKLDKAPHIGADDITRARELLRKIVPANSSPEIIQAAVRHIVLWELVNTRRDYVLDRDMEKSLRTTTLGINISNVLLALNREGIIRRNSASYWVDDPAIQGKYSHRPTK